ncbi:MAG TPA: hypothetical protein VIM80_04905 [Brevefilum sp.]
MKLLSDWITKISSGWVALACLVIFLLFTGLVLPSQAQQAEAYSGNIGSPDTSFYYSSEALYEFAEAYGPQGRSAYIRARLTFDVVWPLVYLAFLGTSISWIIRKSGSEGEIWKRLNLVPVFGLLFDYLENGAAAVVMARYPDLTPILPQIAGVFTAIKWIFIGGSFALLLIVLFIGGWRWVGSKKS